MATLSAKAFIDDPVEAYLYPGRREYPELFVDAQEELLRASFDKGCGAAVVVTLEPSDERWKGSPDIVGFCIFIRTGIWRPRPFIEEPEEPSEDGKDTATAASPAHAMTDLAHYEAFEETCRSKDAKVWTEEGFKLPKARYEFCDLGVDPAFQAQGVGRMMVAFIQEKALQEGVPVHTTSSPSGQGFYRKMGFRKVGRWKWCPEPNMEWDVMHWTPTVHRQDGCAAESLNGAV
ncbi:hypothetical protein B0J12DRAFT_704054 [Macrophomina phaseolina]|uniref:N-acetyltransferase domain-containing protein n=1 Tax=Macrophomina phaseolina TaxID=35725 RepID=A0ABQ8FXS2_9PEZI|nr:hypothetical protein B0J12DRAFT_704054 [Macrophomina phaseolina]